MCMWVWCMCMYVFMRVKCMSVYPCACCSQCCELQLANRHSCTLLPHTCHSITGGAVRCCLTLVTQYQDELYTAVSHLSHRNTYVCITQHQHCTCLAGWFGPVSLKIGQHLLLRGSLQAGGGQGGEGDWEGAVIAGER